MGAPAQVGGTERGWTDPDEWEKEGRLEYLADTSYENYPEYIRTLAFLLLVAAKLGFDFTAWKAIDTERYREFYPEGYDLIAYDEQDEFPKPSAELLEKQLQLLNLNSGTDQPTERVFERHLNHLENNPLFKFDLLIQVQMSVLHELGLRYVQQYRQEHPTFLP